MKHKSSARYPAPSAVVMRMFSDRKFHTDKLDAMGLKKYQVLDHKADAKEFRIRIERKVPMDAPGVIKKFVPLETTVVNEESWTLGSRTGKVKVEAQGMPIDMSCTMAMTDEAGGCVITYQWDINARVPLVGGALEKFVVADLEKRAADETRIGISLLKNYA